MPATKVQEDTNKRFRISIPTGDISVIEFLRLQSNVSFSIRVLVKNFVSEYGYIDATCLADPTMGVPRRPGRPTTKMANQVASYGEDSVPAPPALDTLVQSNAPVQNPVPQQQMPVTAVKTGTDDNEFFDPEKLLGAYGKK